MLGIIGLAFMVSFENISRFAEHTLAVPPGKGWAIPLMVDGSIIVGSIIWLNRSRAGGGARPAQLLVATGALVSVALNLAHSPHNFWAYVVSLIPPTFLVITMEVAMWELRRKQRGTAPAGDVPTQEPATDAQEAPEPEAGGGTPLVPGYSLNALLEAMSELHADGGISGKKLAAAMGRRGYTADERTGRGVLAWLRAAPTETEADESTNGSRELAVIEAELVEEPV